MEPKKVTTAAAAAVATTATTTSRSFEENLVHIFYKRDCPFNGWLVQSSILLDQCPYISQQMPLESLNNVQFKNCLRK